VLDEVPESPQTNYVEQLQRLVCTDVAKSFDNKRILQDFNYTFEAGKHYLIRGASGSGKSTLLKLISKEETLDAGKIAVYDDSQHSFTDFTQNVGMIQQNPYLFNATIRENLSLGQDFQEEQLLTVLQQVGLDQEFPEGLDFQVEDNGKNVSGGQRVRLEIARFLLRQKDILLADEITAALDPANARKVRQLLLSLPIMIIEVAHYVDDLSVYDAVIDWEVA
jgi:ATP-binding cassette subfamily C protein